MKRMADIWVLACAAAWACSAAADDREPSDCPPSDSSCGGTGSGKTGSKTPGGKGPSGAPSSPASTSPPPAPADADAGTALCQELAACCPTIADYADQVVCTALASYGDESKCKGALALCRAGGIGIGGVYECAILAACCDRMAEQGLDTYACEATVRRGNDADCRSAYDDYMAYGDCR